jgi:hypothetical protein
MRGGPEIAHETGLLRVLAPELQIADAQVIGVIEEQFFEAGAGCPEP